METIGITWADDHPEVAGELRRLARKKDVSPEIPSWLPFVPDSKRMDAVHRHVDNLARKKERQSEYAVRRRLNKETRQTVIDAFNKQGYSLTYMYCAGYVVALAFKGSGKPNEVYVYFAVCSVTDLDVYSKVFARELLLSRITSDDELHSFACLVQGQGKMPLPLKATFVKRRFIEYAMMTNKGIPHTLVKRCRAGINQDNLHKVDIKEAKEAAIQSKKRRGKRVHKRVHNF